jgi:hypothetical protein
MAKNRRLKGKWYSFTGLWDRPLARSERLYNVDCQDTTSGYNKSR